MMQRRPLAAGCAKNKQLNERDKPRNNDIEELKPDVIRAFFVNYHRKKEEVICGKPPGVEKRKYIDEREIERTVEREKKVGRRIK
jgi:hypothetical protein